jgi:hypothetical protein
VRFLRVTQIEVVTDRTAIARRETVLGRVDSDPVHPGVEGAVATKLRQCPISFDEGFLCNVFRFSRVANVSQHQLHHFVLVFAHQQIERSLVSALNAFDENQVTLFNRHRSTPAPIELNRP